MATIATRFRLVDEVTAPMNNIRNSVDSATRGFDSMAGKLVAVNAGMQLLGTAISTIKEIGSALGGFVSDASQYEGLMASLTVATGDAIKAQEEFIKLQDFAAHTPFDMPGVVQASVMFRNAGVEAEKLIPTIKMLGDLSQGNNEYFNRMAINFMQIKSSGKATMMDLNQFAYMGVPIKQVLQSMGVEGQATAEQVEEAMRRMTSAGGQFYNSMLMNAGTLSGVMSNLGDSFQQLSADIGREMLPMLKELAMSLSGLIDSIRSSAIFDYVITKVRDTCSTIINNLDIIISTIITVGTISVSTATVMATAWAVVHWRFTLIVSIIATVIRLIYNINSATKQASSGVDDFTSHIVKASQVMGGIIGIIGGTLSSAFNVLYNAFASVYNVGVMFFDLLANLNHPLEAFARFFLNVASSVLEVLATVGGVIDTIFGSNLAQSFNNASQQIQSFKNEKFKVDNPATRLELKEINGGFIQNYRDGAKVGEQIGSMLGSTVKSIMNSDNGINTPAQDVPPLPYDNNGNLKVAVQNEIKIDSRWKDLLMEKAVEQYKIRYANVTPTVSIENMNINNDVDVNDVVDQISYALSNATDSQL